MFLNASQIKDVTKAALDSGLIMDVPRALLMQDLPKGFIMGFAVANTLLDQFQLDLNRLNNVEKLAGGVVPLVVYLRNIADQLALRGSSEAKFFEQLANTVANGIRGSAVTSLPDPATLPEVTRKEVIVGRDDTLSVGFLSGGVAAGRSIARILVPKFSAGTQVFVANGEPWLARGTAWVMARGLAITNHHVINSRTDTEADACQADLVLQATRSTLEFDYDQEGAMVTTAAVTELLHVSKEHDYAILKMAGDGAARPPLMLNPNKVQMTATTHMPVNIIQHPRGKPKRVAFRNNLVSAADGNLLRYFTDTDYGTSGAAVFDDNWRVVGLHRGAKFAEGVSYLGKETAYINFGSQIQAILEDLKSSDNTLYREIVKPEG